jgi:uncharacterized membrane protein
MDDDWRFLPAPVRALPVDLVAVVALTGLALLAVFLPGLDESPLRAPLTVPLLVALPGYALLAVFFPRGTDDRTADDITDPERAVLSVAVSLAILPLVGLVLTVSPRGLDAIGTTLGLAVVTLVCAVAGAVRRGGRPPARLETRPERWWRRRGRVLDTESRREVALTVALVVGMVLAVAVTGAAVLSTDGGETFTGFYLLTADGDELGAEYPAQFQANESTPLVVGIDNHEGEPATYSVVVQLHEVAPGNDSAVLERHDLRVFTSPTIGDGRTWHHPHDIRPPVTGERVRLQYLLYRGPVPDSPTRANADLTTHLWLTGTATE